MNSNTGKNLKKDFTKKGREMRKKGKKRDGM